MYPLLQPSPQNTPQRWTFNLLFSVSTSLAQWPDKQEFIHAVHCLLWEHHMTSLIEGEKAQPSAADNWEQSRYRVWFILSFLVIFHFLLINISDLYLHNFYLSPSVSHVFLSHLFIAQSALFHSSSPFIHPLSRLPSHPFPSPFPPFQLISLSIFLSAHSCWM